MSSKEKEREAGVAEPPSCYASVFYETYVKTGVRYGDMNESVQSSHLLEVQMTLSFNQVLHRYELRLLI